MPESLPEDPARVPPQRDAIGWPRLLRRLDVSSGAAEVLHRGGMTAETLANLCASLDQDPAQTLRELQHLPGPEQWH